MSALVPPAAAALLAPPSASSTGTTVKFMGILAAGFQCASTPDPSGAVCSFVGGSDPGSCVFRLEEAPPSYCSCRLKSDGSDFCLLALFPLFHRGPQVWAPCDVPLRSLRSATPWLRPRPRPPSFDQVVSVTPLECGNRKTTQSLKFLDVHLEYPPSCR